jgi:UDP-N-acetylglucosamine:LPS N-acetylglucosamine transferase
MTGSLGASSVNRAVVQWVKSDVPADVSVIHVTGRRDATWVSEATSELGEFYRAVDFADDMPALWAAADLAICRSGATTVAELIACAIPSILVPLPGAPGDHQTHNARSLAEVGGATVIADSELSAPVLSLAVSAWLGQPERLESARRALRGLHRGGAAGRIAAVICGVARG